MEETRTLCTAQAIQGPGVAARIRCRDSHIDIGVRGYGVIPVPYSSKYPVKTVTLKRDYYFALFFDSQKSTPYLRGISGIIDLLCLASAFPVSGRSLYQRPSSSDRIETLETS